MLSDQKENIIINNPCTKTELEQRNTLLTISLRDTPLEWGYPSEYPLVLNEHNINTSWCVFFDQKLAAHATLWPRALRHRSSQCQFNVGLVGNVATHPEHRGRGFMASLFDHLTKVGRKHELSALILWSDLGQFYQKLGFSSIGRESRFVFKNRQSHYQQVAFKTSPDELSEEDLCRMLELRPKLEWRLERSTQEFRILLSIPNTAIFVRRHNKTITSWLAIGKGADLQGIIHEWGSNKPAELVENIYSIISTWGLPQLTLLAPLGLAGQWQTQLKMHASSTTIHSMALALPLGNNGQASIAAASRCFFWGFDSI